MAHSVSFGMNPLKPSPLRRGDLIGLVSPASPIADVTRIERGVRYLESLGYRTIVGRHATFSNAYLAGSDDQRVADIHEMFSMKEVRGVLCIRGGYGTPRILPLVNYRLIARNPKVFVGYSDITALQLALWKKTRLVTFHGPMLGVDMADTMDQLTEDSFWTLVTSRTRPGRLALTGLAPSILSSGCGTGRLLGGNLSLIVSILGTPFQPDFRKAVLFLEDIGEEPYRIDRMFAQLRNASILSRAGAILSGQFSDCLPRDVSKPSFNVDQLLKEYAHLGSRPFLSGLPFGHETRKLTIPLGIRAKIDADAGTIEYLEPAVW